MRRPYLSLERAMYRLRRARLQNKDTEASPVTGKKTRRKVFCIILKKTKTTFAKGLAAGRLPVARLADRFPPPPKEEYSKKPDREGRPVSV